MLNKPDWGIAPIWANYLAQDGDGYYYWYDSKPYYDVNWGWWDIVNNDDHCLCAGHYDTYTVASESLESRPI